MTDEQPQQPSGNNPQQEQDPVPDQQRFSVNIYPVIYWALTYGAVAGLLLFLLAVLARYITFLWVPVFAVGLVWGAYRNYIRQKREWYTQKGQQAPRLSPMDEFKEATGDIIAASQEMIAREQEEDAMLAQKEAEEQFAAQSVLEQEKQADSQPQHPPTIPPTPPVPPAA